MPSEAMSAVTRGQDGARGAVENDYLNVVRSIQWETQTSPPVSARACCGKGASYVLHVEYPYVKSVGICRIRQMSIGAYNIAITLARMFF